MNRYLFKAKRKDNNEWVFGSLVYDVNKKWYIHENNCAYFIGFHEVIPETICQYTDLNDKNGNMIFENDIVKATYEDKGEYEFKVIYLNSSCMFVLENIEYMACVTFEDVCNIEIIGNKFDEGDIDE